MVRICADVQDTNKNTNTRDQRKYKLERTCK